jgi:hypothetical protein
MRVCHTASSTDVPACAGGGYQASCAARAGAAGWDARTQSPTVRTAQLFLSNDTIKTHISRIFATTGSRDRAAAIGYARRHNIG